MSNILNNNFHNLKLRVNTDEYWDIHVNKDYWGGMDMTDGLYLHDKCLLSYIDASIEECVDGRELHSVSGYSWDKAVTSAYTLHNIGYTGLDNFLIPFRRDSVSNKEFVQIYSGSTYDIIEGDARLTLHAISGGTTLYDYPFSVEEDKIKLNGGFYQGFFETECDKYAVLPSKLENGDTWEYEFVLNKTEFEAESKKTLNDKYPNNKGIFFYIGTRAENKWAYMYNDKGVDETCNTNKCYVTNSAINDYVDDSDMESAELYEGDMIIMPPTVEETFFDEYLTFKYYDNSLYDEGCLDEDDFAFNVYGDLTRRPNVIDEDGNKGKVIGWCCNCTKEKKDVDVRIVCCGCGSCRHVFTDNRVNSSCGKRYFSGCEIFGDGDYLEDTDEFDTEYIENEIDISGIEYSTFEDSFSLNQAWQYYFDTDNKFLFFDRTCDGFNVHNWTSETLVRYCGTKSSFIGNLFLLMNRTCTGYTVHTIDEYRDSFKKEYNIYKDLYNNALAFRITDDGAIGYRYFSLDCESETKTKIREAYSKNGMIKEGEWYQIHVKVDASYNTMKLRFYVNDNLVFVSDDMPKLELRPLHDLYEKQETVPFNISIGGGTQGLSETILPKYSVNPSRTYPLECNFSGTFIGYIKSFRFYNCGMTYSNILNNFKFEMDNLKNIKYL